jgi:dihydrodipicolinate synthase/N-acetylneuraminate lyase
MDCSRRELLAGLSLPSVLLSQPKSAAQTAMRGIFIIMTTPFTESNALDYEDLAKQVGFLDRCGAHGMVWPQLGSQVWDLTKEERMRGMEVLAKAAKGKKPTLVLGVQGLNKEEAIEYTQHAESLAPDALIAIPAREAKTLDDVREYYRAIARLTKRPVIVQTTGGASGLDIDAKFVAALTQEFPHCGYVKEEAQPVIARIKALVEFRPAVKRIYGGADASALMYEMSAGSDGNMPNAAYADIYAQIWDLYQAGNREKAQDLYDKTLLLTNLRRMIPATPLYIMKKRGVFKTIVSRQRRNAKPTQLTPDEVQQIEFSFEPLKPYLRT